MLFIKAYHKLPFILLSNLTTLIDKRLAKISSKNRKITLNKNYDKCLLITCKAFLDYEKLNNETFISGPKLVIKSIAKGLNLISNELLIKDWNNNKWISFFKITGKYNNEKSLICGLASSKLLIAKILNPKSHFVLILMNASTAYRLEQIKDSLKNYKVSVIKEEVPSPFFLQSLLMLFADKVLLVGNSHTLSTYENKGWDISLFKITNAQIDSSFFNTKLSKKVLKNEMTYCFPASLHGHRKGLFYTIYSWIKFFLEVKSLNKDLPTLIMTGKLPKIYDEFLEKRYGPNYQVNFNIQNKGWVSSKELKEIYLRSKFIIAVPLEEGQVAAVLEAIACGIIPIISKDTGITFKQYSYVDNFNCGSKLSLYEALLNSYIKKEYKIGDNFLVEKNRKSFIDYYEQRAVFNSLISIFNKGIYI